MPCHRWGTILEGILCAPALHNLPRHLSRGIDDQHMLVDVHLLLELVQLLPLPRHLLDQDGSAPVHLGDHVVRHDARPCQPPGLELVESSLNRIGAVEFPLRKMSVVRNQKRGFEVSRRRRKRTTYAVVPDGC